MKNRKDLLKIDIQPNFNLPKSSSVLPIKSVDEARFFLFFPSEVHFARLNITNTKIWRI